MAEDVTTFRHSVSVLRSGVFARFMLAEFISMTGAWMQTQAQQLVVEQKVESPMQQALISFALTIVIPLLGPWGGTLADRMDRRRILITVLGTQAVLAAAVGGLVQTGWIQIWQLSIVAVILGVTHAFEGPAYAALIPTLVEREKIGAAVALDRSIFHASRIVGPALAGILAGTLGIASAFYANALSFIAPLILLFCLPPRVPGAASNDPKSATGFMEGWRFVRSDPPTFRMILIMAANTLFCSPVVIVLLTFYARRTLGLKAGEVGLLMALTGVGALIASFTLLAIPKRSRVHFLRGGAGLSFLAMLGLAWAQSFVVGALGFALLTMGLNFIFGVGNQLVQERAPDELRGRISAVASLSFLAVIPFSGILAAFLHDWIGMRAALVACGCGYAIVATALLTHRWPRETSTLAVEVREPARDESERDRGE